MKNLKISVEEALHLVQSQLKMMSNERKVKSSVENQTALSLLSSSRKC
mgnify:CR=1 FL=1